MIWNGFLSVFSSENGSEWNSELFFSSENGSERNSEVFFSDNGSERNSKVLSLKMVWNGIVFLFPEMVLNRIPRFFFSAKQTEF
jgi:hypothetical protein